MLRDRYRQLLTAYVDDELSARQRRYVARLLKRSAEARQLLQQLREDAHALRHLPRPALPADLTGPVLRTIAERRLAARHRRIGQASSATQWLAPLTSWVLAASVLIFLGVTSYLYFTASLSRPATPEIAQQQTDPSTPQPEQLGQSTVQDDRSQSASSEPPEGASDRTSAVQAPATGKTHPAKSAPTLSEKTPTPAKEETALTDRVEMFQLDRAPDLLPVVVKVHGLDQQIERRRLRNELQKDTDFRMELPCQNGTKAFERVQKAAQTLHFGLIVDKKAQEHIKLKWRTNYVLYVEDVTPDEFIHFVQQIGAEDRKSAAGKPAEVRIDRLVVTRMTAQHRKELSTLLGVDPAATAPAPQSGQAVAGQGRGPRPEAGKPAAKSPEHFVLVLPSNPVRPSPGSDEIKQFLANRKPARTGTIRVLLVLRS